MIYQSFSPLHALHTMYISLTKEPPGILYIHVRLNFNLVIDNITSRGGESLRAVGSQSVVPSSSGSSGGNSQCVDNSESETMAAAVELDNVLHQQTTLLSSLQQVQSEQVYIYIILFRHMNYAQ